MAAFALAGCAEPRSVPVIGPDGSRMFHVSCGGDEARCFELAGRICPMGYEMMPTANKNYLVRCRQAGSVAMTMQDGALPPSTSPDAMLAPSPYSMVAPPNMQSLAPNPYRPTPAPTTAPPAGTATFPPLGPPGGRAKGQDLGY